MDLNGSKWTSIWSLKLPLRKLLKLIANGQTFFIIHNLFKVSLCPFYMYEKVLFLVIACVALEHLMQLQFLLFMLQLTQESSSGSSINELLQHSLLLLLVCISEHKKDLFAYQSTLLRIDAICFYSQIPAALFFLL